MLGDEEPNIMPLNERIQKYDDEQKAKQAIISQSLLENEAESNMLK